MMRPACPHCHDSWSVAKLSALYHLEDFPLADTFRPPVAPPAPGRFLAIAILSGLALYLVTAFTPLWLAAAVCIGVFAELVTYWETTEEREEYQAALAWWDAAYYCNWHGVVFIVGKPNTLLPAQFAYILHGSSASTISPGDESQLLLPVADLSHPS
jgi:hypothetical protein